jgi:hypothetical protein
MRLGLNDQLAIKEVFAGFFGKESGPADSRGRAADSTPTGGVCDGARGWA